MTVVGLDVGGANLKVVALSDTGVEYRTVHFPLWIEENCRELGGKLRSIGKEVAGCEPDAVCTVMTAEICDTFRSRKEGVSFIEKSVKSAFPDTEHIFVNCNGSLKSEAKPELEFAAANWVASAKLLTELGNFRDFLFVDMGTTTTDIIPVKCRILAAKTDYERLRRGELLYTGMLRTPVFHVLKYSRTLKAPLVPELYACVGDALLLTGDIGEEDYICRTPDGRGAGRKECMQRIARQFCCDVSELGDFAVDVAFEVRNELIKLVSEHLSWQASKWQLKNVFACGKGDFLIKEAASSTGLRCRLIREEFGNVSEVFPAYACAMLARLKFE